MPLALNNDHVRTRFKDLIRRTCGFTYDSDREETLISALRRRMHERNVHSSEAYHSVLINEQGELHALIELLTVNETYFLREPEHLRLVIDTLVPELLAKRRSGTIRILSAGCSTGEEPYSIAMLLRERYGDESERLFCVTGVDIDSKAIAIARTGVYSKSSFRGMDPAMQTRYFTPAAAGTFQICDTIKRQVSFEVVNLLKGYYPLGMRLPDIIFYRNVSIYFPRDIQREIFGKLAELLTDGGFLVVGASETLHHDVGILSLIERNSLFFYCKSPAPVIMDRREQRRTPAPPEKRCSVQPALPPKEPAEQHAGRKAAPAPAPQAAKAPQAGFDPRTSFDSALEKARNNKHDDALELLETIIGNDQGFVKAHGLKASLLLSMARFEDAHAACSTMLSLDPLCREACLMLGIIARHNGDDGEAFKRFREVLYIDSTCWLAHFYTAEIMFVRRDNKRARVSYETVISILENGSLKELGQAYFPLSFNAQQFISICRHKLSLLKENG